MQSKITSAKQHYQTFSTIHASIAVLFVNIPFIWNRERDLIISLHVISTKNKTFKCTHIHVHLAPNTFFPRGLYFNLHKLINKLSKTVLPELSDGVITCHIVISVLIYKCSALRTRRLLVHTPARSTLKA